MRQSRSNAILYVLSLLLIHLTIGNSAVLVGLFNKGNLLTNGSGCSNQQTSVGEETLRTSAWEAMPESDGSEVTFFGKLFSLNWILGLLYHLIIMAWLTNSQDSCYRKMDLDVHSEDCKLKIKSLCHSLRFFFFVKVYYICFGMTAKFETSW